ncbi:hypothetical protein C1S80_05790 [Mycolicibacterium aubagnense]|nr:hypothetical protein C1S80_05790 [Mycolicibacterium aubagnense]
MLTAAAGFVGADAATAAIAVCAREVAGGCADAALLGLAEGLVAARGVLLAGTLRPDGAPGALAAALMSALAVFW